MQPEIKLLLDLLIETSNDCASALIAYLNEKDKVKKQMLFTIYEEKDKEAERISKEMYRLTKIL